MAAKLIELEDGTLVEVEVSEAQAEEVSSRFADKVSTTFEKIKPVLLNACRPIAAVWKEISQEMEIQQAEVEIDFSFEAEGNIYITKGKAGSNLKVKLVLKPNKADLSTTPDKSGEECAKKDEL